MAESKLKNIKAVKEFLDGSHRRQTNKTFGWSDAQANAEKSRTKEIGEIWSEVDLKGNTIWWEQKSGYRVKYGVHPEVSKSLNKIKEYLASFPNCQKEVCTCLQPSNLDLKFKRMMGMCHDCLVKLETDLKIKGEFNDYAIQKMKANAEAFFKQSDIEVELMKRELANVSYVTSEHGDIESWKNENLDQMLENIDKSYSEFKEKTFMKLEGKLIEEITN